MGDKDIISVSEVSEVSEVTEDEVPLTPITDNFSNLDPSFLVPTSLANESIISYSADSSSTTDATTEYIIEEIEEKPQEQEEEKDNGPRFYHRRRFWAMCIAITVVLSAIFIPLLFLVIIPDAAQGALNKSKLDFKSINITDPTNSSFIINMLGETTKAGSVSATVSFNGAVKILYNETLIGSVQLSPLKVSKGSGVVTGNNQVFTIEDLPTFNDFSSKILTENSFTWTLRGSANVHALGITTKNVKLDKEVEIPGSNGFITNVKDLKITQNQDKTLRIEAVTSIYNPSPIGIEIGVMHIQLGYEQSIITDTSINNITIAAGENDLPFVGNAQLPTSDEDKSNYIKIMNAYLTNKPLKTYAKVLSVLPKSGIPVGWLSKATEGLVLSAMVGNQTEPPQIIKNIDFGKVIIKFTPDAPYSPTISSTNATAGFDLPFKVPFKINAVSQNLTIFFKNHPVATLVAPETSAIGTDTNLILNVQETNMNVIKGSEENFSDLFTSLTTDKAAEIIIAGETNINVTTDILGNTLIQGLPLNVTTNLQGFNQFNSDGSAPTVSNLNVIAGTSNQLITGMIVTLANPSQYSISVGKVSLDLFYKEQQIGTAVIDNLSVSPGANPVFVVSTINDPVKNSGIDLFTNLLSGQASTVNIRGSDNSTDIKSLVKSFKAINISSTIPPINQNFFTNAKVVIDNQTMAVKAFVEISNNFNAPISIYTMNSSFSAFGITLGSLDQDLTKNPIFILGNSAVNVELPVTMSFDPVSLFSITRQAAIRNGLDVTVLDSLIALSNINVPGADPNAKPTPDAAKSFDLKTFITTALGKIPASFTANSHVAIGNYFMPMTYKQDIDVATDDSILLLVPMLSSQLINQAVDKTQVTTDTIFIKNIDVTSYDVFTVGQISNISPLAAQISFPTGVKISSNNVFLGVMYPQPISLAPLEGVQFNNSVAKFVIADIPSFTEYSGRMFNAESLTWDTEADIMVTTSGITMGPISMKKSIQLAGFNGLQQVTLKNFDPKFTSDGLNLNAEVEVTNPSNIGIELGKIVFNLYVQGKQISSVTSDVVINPKGISDLTFQGVIKPEDLQSILSTVGQNVPITVQGVSVTPPKATGDVPWLTIPTQKTIRNFPLNVNALEPPASAPPPSAPPQQ